MALNYVGQGGALAVTTSVSPAHPAVTLGDVEILFVSSDASGIQDPAGDWVALTPVVTGGGLSCKAWTRTADGTESGTVTVNVTSGTKGVALIAAYQSTIGRGLTVPTATSGTDTDSSSTVFSITAGSSITTENGDMIACPAVALAPSGAYSSISSRVVSQSGATVTDTARFGGLTASSTIAYCWGDGTVTAGGTGAAAFNATANGANAAGVALFIQIHETVIVTPEGGPAALVVRGPNRSL